MKIVCLKIACWVLVLGLVFQGAHQTQGTESIEPIDDTPLQIVEVPNPDDTTKDSKTVDDDVSRAQNAVKKLEEENKTPTPIDQMEIIQGEEPDGQGDSNTQVEDLESQLNGLTQAIKIENMDTQNSDKAIDLDSQAEKTEDKQPKDGGNVEVSDLDAQLQSLSNSPILDQADTNAKKDDQVPDLDAQLQSLSSTPVLDQVSQETKKDDQVPDLEAQLQSLSNTPVLDQVADETKKDEQVPDLDAQLQSLSSTPILDPVSDETKKDDKVPDLDAQLQTLTSTPVLDQVSQETKKDEQVPDIDAQLQTLGNTLIDIKDNAAPQKTEETVIKPTDVGTPGQTGLDTQEPEPIKLDTPIENIVLSDQLEGEDDAAALEAKIMAEINEEVKKAADETLDEAVVGDQPQDKHEDATVGGDLIQEPGVATPVEEVKEPLTPGDQPQSDVPETKTDTPAKTGQDEHSEDSAEDAAGKGTPLDAPQTEKGPEEIHIAPPVENLSETKDDTPLTTESTIVDTPVVQTEEQPKETPAKAEEEHSEDSGDQDGKGAHIEPEKDKEGQQADLINELKSLETAIEEVEAEAGETDKVKLIPVDQEAMIGEVKSGAVDTKAGAGHIATTHDTPVTFNKIQDKDIAVPAQTVGITSSMVHAKTSHAPITHTKTTKLNNLPTKTIFKPVEGSQGPLPEAVGSLEDQIQSLTHTKIPASHLVVKTRTHHPLPSKVFVKPVESGADAAANRTEIIGEQVEEEPQKTPLIGPVELEGECKALSHLASAISMATIPSNGKLLSQTLNRFRRVAGLIQASGQQLSPCCRHVYEEFIRVVYCQVMRSLIFLKDYLVDDLVHNQQLLKEVRFALHFPEHVPELDWANHRLNVARNEMASQLDIYVTKTLFTGEVINLKTEVLRVLTSMHKIDALHKQAYLQIIESIREPAHHPYVTLHTVERLRQVYSNMADLSANSKIFSSYYPVLVKTKKLLKAINSCPNTPPVPYRNLVKLGIQEALKSPKVLINQPVERALTSVQRLKSGLLKRTDRGLDLKKTLEPMLDNMNKIHTKLGVQFPTFGDKMMSAAGTTFLGNTLLLDKHYGIKTQKKYNTLRARRDIRSLILTNLSSNNNKLRLINNSLKSAIERTDGLTESTGRIIDSKSAYNDIDATSILNRI